MARLPVDPRYARVLLAAGVTGCGADAVGVVAVVSAENHVFVRPR